MFSRAVALWDPSVKYITIYEHKKYLYGIASNQLIIMSGWLQFHGSDVYIQTLNKHA